MSSISRSHSFEFSIYHQPSVSELVTELQCAAEAIGYDAKVHIKTYDDQRDGFSMKVKIEEAT